MNAVRNIRDGQSFFDLIPSAIDEIYNSFTTFLQTSLNEINRILGSMTDGMKGCDELPAKIF